VCSAVSCWRHLIHAEIFQAVCWTSGTCLVRPSSVPSGCRCSCVSLYACSLYAYLNMQVPLHLREDFSGTSLISATWCKSDVRRTAVGVDIDREALQWGWKHNGQAMLGQAESQLCLVEASVRHTTHLTAACMLLPAQIVFGHFRAAGCLSLGLYACCPIACNV